MHRPMTASNLGLSVLESPEAASLVRSGNYVEIDIERGSLLLSSGKEVEVRSPAGAAADGGNRRP